MIEKIRRPENREMSKIDAETIGTNSPVQNRMHGTGA
jgi:hypothetical protein